MKYSFSLRIDNSDHTMTKESGLPLGAMAGLFSALSNAIGMEDSNAVLVDVHSNCVRYELMTEDERVYSNFKIVHSNIQEKHELDWTPTERDYARSMKKIIKQFGVTFEALDAEKSRIVKIREIKQKHQNTHYHETTTISGMVIGFGGRDLEKPQMLVQTRDGNKISISISSEIEKRFSGILSEVYKKGFIELSVRVRVSLTDDKREYALLDFEVPEHETLFGSISAAISSGEDLFPDVVDSGEAIRRLRNNE